MTGTQQLYDGFAAEYEHIIQWHMPDNSGYYQPIVTARV